MYAISFVLKIDTLKKTYGDPYYGAYKEIEDELTTYGFEWTQGSLYILKESDNYLGTVYKAISALKKISWFKESVRDVRVFKVEDWSDFTSIVKE